jgi:hypothetical protein
MAGSLEFQAMRLAEQLGEAMQACQRAVDMLDQCAADLLGLNRTE